MMSQRFYEAFWLQYAFLDVDEGTWSRTQSKGQKRGCDELTIMGGLFSPLVFILVIEFLAVAEKRFMAACEHEGITGVARWAPIWRVGQYSFICCDNDGLRFFLFSKNSRRKRILIIPLRRYCSDYFLVDGSCNCAPYVILHLNNFIWK